MTRSASGRTALVLTELLSGRVARALTAPLTSRRTRAPRPLPAAHVKAPKEHGHG
ncbi:hypothetical protein ABZ250_21395 [Streptomyces afghaniensis]|uniref:hypothetical protein n=1 Tax=Streptomyces afghaniensis TaxID=66865 RepID=UPI0033AB0571